MGREVGIEINFCRNRPMACSLVLESVGWTL